MKTKEIRERHPFRFIVPRGEFLSSSELDGVKLYNERVKYLMDQKRKGDVKLISDITGLSQQYIERSIYMFSHRHHITVIDILDDIVTNREALKDKYNPNNDSL
ncbi:hypothetical protein [Flavobacterium sp.]|uniref:hypothetical protein n=1 Tax=Flavobacterium sp. TaxID=239 RepID=UPI00262365EA|nr:hypothetical protein [Flavobacterium sp.]